MSTVLHQVLLADLVSLADVWEISRRSLGLEINKQKELVPRIVDDEDGGVNVYEMEQAAGENFPECHPLDFVVLVQEGRYGNKMMISTLDQVFSTQGRAVESHWWTFTDAYLDQMN
ncbi:MAG: hypothetical protein Q8L30_00750 [bacterium]|nr:hypothetical protein [bacterium]